MHGPSPDEPHPLKGFPQVGFLKTLVKNPNIVVGDYSYYDDPDGPEQFEAKCVLYHFPFIGDTPQTDKFPYKGDTVIGNDVWLGYNVLVMPSVRIGDGAIVAARSVVVSNVPAYSVVGGNPAKIVKQRFPDEVVNELLAIKLRDWPVEKITRNLPGIVGCRYSSSEKCTLIETSHDQLYPHPRSRQRSRAACGRHPEPHDLPRRPNQGRSVRLRPRSGTLRTHSGQTSHALLRKRQRLCWPG